MSVLWILEFYGKTHLINLLKNNCDENEDRKTGIITKYCQTILTKKILEKIKEKPVLENEEWVKEMKNVEKMDLKQIKINSELYMRCDNHQWVGLYP